MFTFQGDLDHNQLKLRSYFIKNEKTVCFLCYSVLDLKTYKEGKILYLAIDFLPCELAYDACNSFFIQLAILVDF